MKNGPERTPIPEREDGDPELLRLERKLQQALLPEDPPAGFADRLMARALSGGQPTAASAVSSGAGNKLLGWPMRRMWISGGIAAALILGLSEGEIFVKRMRDEQRRIAQATAQFETTERVTVHALAQAREQLQRAGVPLNLD